MLLTGPFGGLTDDIREFLRCLADDGLPLTGWGELDPARMSPSPDWFALTGTAPALVAAAAAMSGPEPPASLAAATAN